jgi:hypothetical protein
MKPEPQTELSPLLRALISLLDWMQSRGEERAHCNTPARLLDVLQKHGGDAAKAPGFPVNVQRLGMALSSEKAALMTAGIITASKRDHVFGRLWLIGEAGEFPDEDALLDCFDDEKGRKKRLWKRCQAISQRLPD